MITITLLAILEILLVLGGFYLATKIVVKMINLIKGLFSK